MDRVHESRPCRMVEQEPHYGTEQQDQLVRLSIDYNIPFFLSDNTQNKAIMGCKTMSPLNVTSEPTELGRQAEHSLSRAPIRKWVGSVSSGAVDYQFMQGFSAIVPAKNS